MLTSIVSLSVLLSLFPNNLLIFPLLSFFFILLYFTSSSLYFCSCQLSSLFYFDEFSSFIVFITMFVLLISFVVSFSLPFSSHRHWALFFTFTSCVLVFTTSNIIVLYLFYEVSLLPIIYIIIKWGSYPERSLSAVMFFIYTSFFTFPFFFFLISMSSALNTFHLSFIDSSLSPSYMCSIAVFLCFSVKLPIYGLHFWLPMAHVEAPTFGSIILAGVLLKLGGIGLLRFHSLVSWDLITSLFSSYLFICLVLATLICCYQSDFKRLVAYSSVSHITPIPLLFIASNILSHNTSLLVIFFHGFASPILFMLVGVFYSIFSTRQLLLIRGILLTSPLLSFLCILAFFYTMSAPPFPSFLSEVFILLSSLPISNYFLVSFGFFLLLSLLYNLNWLTSFLFSSNSSSSLLFSLPFSLILPISTSFIVSVVFIPLFTFF